MRKPELQPPMRPVNKPLESFIEKSVVRWGKARNVLAIKLNGIGQRSWPDRLFIGPHGGTVFIEFKREGAKLTPLQAHTHQDLATRRIPVYVVDNVKVGTQLIEEWCLAV